jgi:hypothetical protein
MPPNAVKMAAEKKVFDNHSRSAVETVFGSVAKNLNGKYWIPSSNHYFNDCVNKINQPPIKSNELAEYIAASVVLHCFDGWAYLGRAIDCHNRGDKDNARHLAYYAELRASISILAAEGIGVFDKKHFVIESNNSCKLIPSNNVGTHGITWRFLDWLSNDSQWRDLIYEIIQPDGKSLKDWLTGFGVSPAPVAQQWLNDWGLDIKRLADDRDARNESSYRPTRLKNRKALNVEEAHEFITNLWNSLEPDSPVSLRFKQLDRFLLRRILEVSFRGQTGKTHLSDKSGFSNRIKSLLLKLNFTPPYSTELFDFFTRKKEPQDPFFLQQAEKKDAVDSPLHHMQVIGRALLMLRLSSSMSSRLISFHSIKRKNIEFWIEKLGEEIGLWDKNAPPAELIDLWQDIKVVLEELEIKKSKGGYKKPSSFYQWREKENINAISLMGSLERVGLWGLGI